MYVKNEAYQLGVKLREHLIARFAVRISHEFEMVIMVCKFHSCRMELLDSGGKLLNQLLDAVLATVLFFDPADSDILASESLVLLDNRIGVVDDSVE